jgi:hypothetical protein
MNYEVKKYYLHNGQENSGPFDKEELREQKINKNTLVWAEDWNEWKKAGEIDELKIILLSIPPTPSPPKHNLKRHQIASKKFNFIKYLVIAISLLVFLTIAVKIISEYNSNPDNPDLESDTLKMQTRNNITNLIQVTTNQFSVDAFGGISNLNVIVSNNTNYTIDQVIVAIDYIKKNDGTYKTEYLTFNNIPAYQNKSLSAPDSDRGLSVKLTKQTITAAAINLCFDNNITPIIGDPDPFRCN